MVSRRALLGAAGAVALTACLPERASVEPSPSFTASPGPSPTRPVLDDRAWSSLAGSMRGELLRPADPRYVPAARLYNTRFDHLRPLGVARCATVDDVRSCVRFARDHGLPIAMRSGGHSYGGWSTSQDGLVVDVGPMRTISIEGTRATVGAGARLIDVYAAVADRGLGIPAGSCPTVGIAGLTLGGGLGVLARQWGLTCDNLVAATVVTADGEVRRCDASTERDLFWALRGGGAGFGAVTSLIFEARAIDTLSVSFLTWPWSAALAVAIGWQRWLQAAPARSWSNIHYQAPAGGAPTVSLQVVTLGSLAELNRDLDDLIAAIGITPATRFAEIETYRENMLVEAGCLRRTLEECHLIGDMPGGVLERETYTARSAVLERPASAATLEAVISALDRVRSRPTFGAAVLFDALGGVVAQVPPDATAFPHRSALAVTQLLASWAPGGPGEADGLAWLRTLYASVRASLGSGAYVNYADPELPDWDQAYFGGNLPRLQVVKRAYDPENLFRTAQGVAPG